MARSVPTTIGNVVPLNYMVPTQLGDTSWSKVSAGTSYTVGIKSDNTLYTWGLNSTGQLGIGDTINRSSPIQLNATGISNFSAISAGLDHVAAITTDGRLYTWGNSTAVNTQTVVQSWTQISYGGTHTLAIRNDGALFSWGTNTVGQLGDGTTVNKSSPVLIGAGSSWIDVSAGTSYSMAIRNDNKLFTWGLNNAGQLGLSTTLNRFAITPFTSTIPVDNSGTGLTIARTGGTAMTPLTPFSSITTNGNSAYFNGTTDSLTVATNAVFGFGTGDFTIEFWVYPLSSARQDWIDITNGTQRILVYYSGTAIIFFSVPTNAAAITGPAITLNVWTHIAVSKASGTTNLYVNGVSQGTPYTTNQNYGASSSLTIGHDTAGATYATGYMSNVRIVKGVAVYTENFTLPTAALTATQSANVNGSPSAAIASGTALLTLQDLGTTTSWVDISASLSHSTAVDSTGKLYAWGLNNAGQLGDTTTINKSSPVQISVGTSWTTVSGGSSFTVGVASTGALYTWGLNSVYQLGDQTTINKSEPSQVGTSSWTTVSAGTSHTLAIRTDATLWTWGQNTAIGVVVETQSWTSISVSQSHALAIKSDGSLWAWGTNTNGQLGTTDTLNRSMPVLVNGLSSYSVVYAGPNTSYAIRSDGKLFTWGLNTSYQMGDGSAVSKSSPVLIHSNLTWSKISGGISHAMGITTSNYLWGWGVQAQGQLGTNGTGTKTAPVQIATLATPTDATGISVISKTGDPIICHHSPFASGSYDPATYGGSAYFSGLVTDGYSLPHSTSLDLTSGDFTIECWAYITNIANGGYIYNKSGQTGTNVGAYAILVRASGASLDFQTQNSTGGTAGQQYSFGTLGTTILANTWYHLAVTRSGTTISTYRNGTRITSVTQTTAITDRGSTFNIGNQGTGGSGAANGAFAGYISNLRIVKGVVVYTGTSFTPPTAPLTTTQSANVNGSPSAAIASGTTLLTLNAGIGTPTSWSQVSANSSHSIAINSAGNLFGWGFNASYQIGDNTTITKSSPVQITSGISTSFNAISAGFDHNLALSTTNKLYAWGSSTAIGYANDIYSWTKIASGVGHTAGIRSDGLLFTWGNNAAGQLGLTDTINRSSPVLVGNPNQGTTVSNSWTAVDAGGSTTVAIRSDGSIWAWGLGTSGELGTGTAANRSSPVQIGATTGWSKVIVGTNHTVAIKTDSTAYAWGLNTSGQLGINNSISRSSPVQVTTTLASSWNLISAGSDHTLGIASTGALYGWGKNDINQAGVYGVDIPRQMASLQCPSFDLVEYGGYIKGNSQLWMWGNNDYGNLGFSPVGVNRSSPVQVAGSWSQVACAIWLAHGIKTDGTLWSWGVNQWGQLATNDTINRSSPTQIGVGKTWRFLNTYQDSATNASQTYAIDSDYMLWGWGGNGTNNWLGDGNNYSATNISSPVQIGSESWSMVAGQVGIKTNGTMWAWGANGNGQVGNNSTDVVSSMVQIGAGIGNGSWTFIAGGTNSFFIGGNTGISYFAINTLGELYSWGYNANFNLGLGNDTINRSNPTKVGSSSWVAVSNGGAKSMGIDIFGKLYMWGKPTNATDTGFYGITTLSQPVQIAAGTSFVAIPSKFNSARIASATTGAVFVWGRNNIGQLGLNATNDRSSPTQLGTITLLGIGLGTSVSAPAQVYSTPLNESWISVSAGQSFSVAVSSTNKLWTWGLNNAGQLGDLTTVNKLSFAVQIGTSSWTSVYAGLSVASAIRSDGGLFTWGLGSSGELGTTTTINRSSPTQVGTSSFTFINAGSASVSAIKLDNTAVVFGLNTSGQIGNVDALSKSSPVTVGSAGLKTSTTYPFNIDINNSWTAIAAGQSHSTAIRATTGALFAWGLGLSGQLGQNNAATYSSPVQIGTSSWTSVSAGSSFTVGIKTDSLMYAWGLGTTGQVADNSAVTKSSPVLIGNGQGINNNTMSPVQIGVSQGIATSWSKISAGNSTSMAVRTVGDLYVWGLGTTGQIGQGNALSYSSPTQIGVNSPITDGSTYAFTVTKAGNPIMSYISPFASGTYDTTTYGGAAKFSGTNDYLAINPDTAFTFGTGDYTIEAWIYTNSLAATSTIVSRWTGGSAMWRVDLTTAGEINLAYNPGGFTTTGAAITTGVWYHIAVVRSTSIVTIYVNGVAKLTPTSSTYNMEVAGFQDFTQQVYIGSHTAGSSLFNGYISNVRLVKGLGVYTSAFTPPTQPLTATQSANVNGNPSLAISGTSTGLLTLHTLSIASWTSVSTNLSGLAAIRSDNVLQVWGDNATGTLGTNSVINRSSPVIVQGFNSETKSFAIQIPGSWSAVAAGQSHVAAINSDYKLYAWGLGTSGQLGTNDAVTRSSPTQIGTSSWSQVFATGGLSTYGIEEDGTLYAWGLGTTGQATGYFVPVSRSSPTQIGNNFLSINQSSPAQIGVGSWTKVAAGTSFNAAIKSDGTLYAWGLNTSGQVGDSTTVAKSSPVQVSGSWSEVSAGTDHIAAIRNDNIMLLWGNNAQGQLGTYNSVNRSSPTLLTGSYATTSWTKVAAGLSYTMATDTSSLLYTWGINGSGQLGLNNAAGPRSSPTLVSSTLSFTVLTAGATIAGGIASTGLAYHWGIGTSGQIAETYNLLNRSTPTTIGGAYPLNTVNSPNQVGTDSWLLVSAGNSYSVAIRNDYKLFAWGLGTGGQLAMNDNITRSSPTQISTKDWNTVSAGLSHVLGITR